MAQTRKTTNKTTVPLSIFIIEGGWIKSIVPGYNNSVLLYRAGGNNAALLGEMNELCHGFSLHLPHDPAAVNFDRLEGSPPLKGDLLAQHPIGD
jgi:hypothetical protein